MSLGEKSLLYTSLAAAMLLAFVPSARSAEIDAAKLVENSDCIACHAATGMEQRIGPPFEAIALRYKGADAATIDKMATKVEKGGAGAWGVVPMASHPQLSHAETTAIVKWILSQKPATPGAGSTK